MRHVKWTKSPDNTHYTTLARITGHRTLTHRQAEHMSARRACPLGKLSDQRVDMCVNVLWEGAVAGDGGDKEVGRRTIQVLICMRQDFGRVS